MGNSTVDIVSGGTDLLLEECSPDSGQSVAPNRSIRRGPTVHNTTVSAGHRESREVSRSEGGRERSDLRGRSRW